MRVNPRWLPRAVMAGLAVPLVMGQTCIPAALMSLEDLAGTYSGAEPVSAFDGEWLSAEHGFAMKIENRVGVVTVANSEEREVGDIILVITSADEAGFSGRWRFMDNSVHDVTGLLADAETLSMSGAGWEWTMTRSLVNLAVSVVGQGTVQPDPGVFDWNESVTVTAVAAEGWRFDHWEGDLAGGPYDHWRTPGLPVANPATLLMSGDRSVTAVFKERQTETAVLDLGGGVLLKVIHIAGGTFTMGSSDEEQARFAAEGVDYSDESPQHAVTVSAFAMSEVEVTQGQFLALMGYLPGVPEDCDSDCIEVPTGIALPVAWTNWVEAVVFCDALSALSGRPCRLPTEAEWEYACRAGSTTAFSFGDSEENLGEFAWYRDNSSCVDLQYETCMHEVAGKLPNDFGLYDMHGNVWEWVGDWWGLYAAEGQADPVGPAIGASQVGYKVLRGGAFQRFPWALRSAYRYGLSPAAQFNFGFRVVCE